MYLLPNAIFTSVCLLLPGLSPAYQMTARKPGPGTSTDSGWDSVWRMSNCPITQRCSSYLAPRPTPSLTSLAASVSCPTGPHVTSEGQTTCPSSSSPTLPTLLWEVCRYSANALVLTFPKPKVASPSWLLALFPCSSSPSSPTLLSDCPSVQPPPSPWEGQQ